MKATSDHASIALLLPCGSVQVDSRTPPISYFDMQETDLVVRDQHEKRLINLTERQQYRNITEQAHNLLFKDLLDYRLHP